LVSASSSDLIPLIRKLESIAQLSDEERQAVEGLPTVIRLLQPRQDIVRDKDRPGHCCLVLSGWTYRYKLLSEGKRQILSFHIPGDLPDLQSLHLRVMDHSLATLTACRLAFIPHESLRELTTRFPGLGATLWRDTLIDAAIFREWMTGIGRRTAFGRIAHVFCEMYLTCRRLASRPTIVASCRSRRSTSETRWACRMCMSTACFRRCAARG
jgi:CRP-like cAMP-binding protein